MAIVFFAPNEEMGHTARRIFMSIENNVLVIQKALSEVVPTFRQLEPKNLEVIIARGGTALLLKKEGVTCPIVEVPLTTKDIVQALLEVKCKSNLENPSIGVVAFPNMIQNLLDIIPILGLNLRCYTLISEEDAAQVVDTAIAEGAQVLLGGVVTEKIAKERRFPVVILHSGESAFRQAFQEARRIADARRLESQRSNELKAILEYAHEGIVAANKVGKITVYNPVAELLIGVHQEDALGRPVEVIVPHIDFTEVLEGGAEVVGQLVDFGKSKVILSRIPIRVSGEIVGGVAIFQDVTRIQSMEERIRQEIYSKGHVAKFGFQDISGESACLLDAIAIGKRYAQVDSTVLIRGETGVGKELFAQSIHNASNRASGPFVAVNCAALSESLLESELFGYVEGAFTGARRQGKPGLFELAHHGTIFLDEISEIPLSLQGKLLRVLQEREVIRLGHDRVIPIDVRVLCATNRDLDNFVEEGRFRKDLYWRLNVLSLLVPPLRERENEILPLTRLFLDSLYPGGGDRFKFTEDAQYFLINYSWPGNVRELRNFCERLVVIREPGTVDGKIVKRLVEHRETSNHLNDEPSVHPMEIEQALKQANGSISRAAQILGVHRVTLWRWRRCLLRQPVAKRLHKPPLPLSL